MIRGKVFGKEWLNYEHKGIIVYAVRESHVYKNGLCYEKFVIPWILIFKSESVSNDVLYVMLLLCKGTTDVLSDFRRKQDMYPLTAMVMTSYHDLGLLVLDVEEKCAQV